jgi:hypothetical protein
MGAGKMNFEDIDWEKQEWDFYYSDKQFVLGTILSPAQSIMHEERGRVTKAKINGKWKNFTERVPKGENPVGNWDDLVFVGTGKKTKEVFLSDDELDKLAIKMGKSKRKK